MSAKHTPGPWAFKAARDGSGDVGITANGVLNVIAECFAAMRHAGECATEEAIANARLISAAPDLLEALTKAEWALVVAIRAVTASAGFTGDELDEIIRENPAVKAARAAIARATGEQG